MSTTWLTKLSEYNFESDEGRSKSPTDCSKKIHREQLHIKSRTAGINADIDECDLNMDGLDECQKIDIIVYGQQYTILTTLAVPFLYVQQPTHKAVKAWHVKEDILCV